MGEQIELTLPQPGAWTPPKAKGKFGCGRDPMAGPGSCYHWWDGCPKAEKRGCFILHARKLREQKKRASRAIDVAMGLDGREHNEMPERA